MQSLRKDTTMVCDNVLFTILPTTSQLSSPSNSNQSVDPPPPPSFIFNISLSAATSASCLAS